MYSIVDRSYGKLYISSRNPHKPEKIPGFNANYTYRFLLILAKIRGLIIIDSV